MAGGLIQLVSSGNQDVALTHNPEITFFKKKYRRHTNFSLELKEIPVEQQASYGDSISFNLPTNGDLIYRCFVKVQLPAIQFSDSIIKNNNYILWKNNYISRLNNNVTKWQNLYSNFKNYVSIELILYQQLLTLFLSDNLVLDNLRQTVIRFNNIYKTQINSYIIQIDINLYNKIDMSGYLLSINQLLTNDLNTSNPNYISISVIQNNLNTMYNTMTEYLTYYHSNWKQNLKIYNKFINNASNINFAWSQYLGHYYFSKFELDIGGQIVEQYSSDQLHIYQYHHLQEEQINNYNVMIGHDPILYDFNTNTKNSKLLLIPLIFFFNKNAGSALPIIAMRNTTTTISLTINNLKNLIYFRDWEVEYNNLLILQVDFTGVLDETLNYSSYKYIVDSKQIIYKLKNLNYRSLELIYYQLNSSDINLILSFGTNNILLLNDWISFKNNLSKYPDLQTKLGGYDSYIDYNYLLNLIPKPNIKLLVEYVFLDDVERKKLTSSKLEYVVEGFQENIFDLNNLLLFDGEISLDKPNKYLKWFVQPKNFLNGLSEYGKVTPYIYNYSKYYVNKIFNQQIITLNQLNIINTQIDNSFYELVQGYQTLNRTLPDGVYYYTFSLYPEELQPSGSANLSVIKEKKFRYEMNQLFLNEYFNPKINPLNLGLQAKILSVSYNFFVVQNGLGRLIFTLS
jgi:hypothetical protein